MTVIFYIILNLHIDERFYYSTKNEINKKIQEFEIRNERLVCNKSGGGEVQVNMNLYYFQEFVHLGR